MWPLPLFDEYRDQLKSEIADLTNTGGRPAGSITAALFLKEFTGGLPWAHLDIAGTAWADEAKPYPAEGAERRRGPHAGGARVRDSWLDVLGAAVAGADHRHDRRARQSRAGLADVLLGSLGLTGVLGAGARSCSALVAGVLVLGALAVGDRRRPT